MIFKEIIKYRELLFTLTMKELRVRYKQTLLGVAWAVFVPLATMLVFTLVFTRFARFDTGEIPYPVFALCGILAWTFFSTSLGGAVDSLVNNSHLITKIYFPRAVFPLSSVLSNLPDLLTGAVILFILMVVYEIPFDCSILLAILVLVLQLILTTGLALILSVGNLFFRDVRYIFRVIILLWMFLTPVFYSIELLEGHRWLLFVNPMAPIVALYRAFILNAPLIDAPVIICAICSSTTIFIVGTIVFYRTEHLFAKNI